MLWDDLWDEEASDDGLVSAFRAGRVVDPVQDDERQTADHEEDANHQENGRLLII